MQLRYKVNGEWKTDQSEYFLYGQTISLLLPKYAVSPYLTVQNMVFIEIWRTIYEAELLPSQRICMRIYGTTFHPIVVLNC